VVVDFATEVSQSIRLGVGHPFGAHGQILMFLCLTTTFFVIHVRRPL
jgi:hypothetical protein